MNKSHSAKVRYLDASALIKLVIDEKDCDYIRDFYRSNVNFCTTSLCVSEAISMIKGMWKKGKPGYEKLTTKQYFDATKKLLGNTHSIVKSHGKIEIDESLLTDMTTHAKVEEIALKYQLDLSDALQLYTIQNGKYSILILDSASILITADRLLAAAANKMGIRVWNCSEGPAPEWA